MEAIDSNYMIIMRTLNHFTRNCLYWNWEIWKL